jgi:hypothetical protein
MMKIQYANEGALHAKKNWRLPFYMHLSKAQSVHKYITNPGGGGAPKIHIS